MRLFRPLRHAAVPIAVPPMPTDVGATLCRRATIVGHGRHGCRHGHRPSVVHRPYMSQLLAPEPAPPKKRRVQPFSVVWACYGSRLF